MRRNVLLDLVRVLALALIGAGIYLSVGATATLIYAGLVLLVVSAVADMRRRGVA
ncbi:MAG: hypothetical protein KAX65_05680 [Caldilineaceae bacterium]|nr:hypothetical protein [Caldilineaceae bacterium]